MFFPIEEQIWKDWADFQYFLFIRFINSAATATTFYRKHRWIKGARGGGSTLFYVLKKAAATTFPYFLSYVVIVPFIFYSDITLLIKDDGGHSYDRVSERIRNSISSIRLELWFRPVRTLVSSG